MIPFEFSRAFLWSERSGVCSVLPSDDRDRHFLFACRLEIAKALLPGTKLCVKYLYCVLKILYFKFKAECDCLKRIMQSTRNYLLVASVFKNKHNTGKAILLKY